MSRKILYVEDDLKTAQVVRAVLTAKGHEVRVTTTGGETLTVIRDMHPDLLLIDINLPDMDGLELAAQLRADQDTYFAAVPIIAISGFATIGEYERILDSGCNDYITKPFTAAEILGTLAKYL